MGNNLLVTEADDINELREAIIELYLAIKIRSTEEVSDLKQCLGIRSPHLTSDSLLYS